MVKQATVALLKNSPFLSSPITVPCTGGFPSWSRHFQSIPLTTRQPIWSFFITCFFTWFRLRRICTSSSRAALPAQRQVVIANTHLPLTLLTQILISQPPNFTIHLQTWQWQVVGVACSIGSHQLHSEVPPALVVRGWSQWPCCCGTAGRTYLLSALSR